MKKRTGEPWMEPGDYARTLRGFNVNLIVRDVARAVAFQAEVLHVTVVYHDTDLAVLRHQEHQWMVHAEHAYIDETGGRAPFLTHTASGGNRGLGVELRLYGIDPDAAEARARAAGYRVLAPAEDKPHGLRETYLVDTDGYVWVPGIAPGSA